MLKWQEESLARIKAMSNLDLVNETIDAGMGDSWDGCFTDRGEWEFEQLRKELSKRLLKAKFIKQELED